MSAQVIEHVAVLPDGPGTDDVIIARGRRVLELECNALSDMQHALDSSFVRAVRLIASSKGRVIVSGVGKSGLVARKIAATMTSTGTPAMFLHPIESLHGDLGMVGADDVAILISKSGNTDELSGLIDALARLGVHLIAMTTDATSHLARQAEITLVITGREEACPHDLAPTTSTTSSMALGDALAVALLQEKSFQADDFARLHPGGSLGRRLLTRVGDVMDLNAMVVLSPDSSMKDAVVLLAKQRGLAIVAEHDKVLGVVTGGDLARFLERDADLTTPVHRVMGAKPRIARESELGSAVVHRMEQSGIMAMPVVDDNSKLVDVVHLHDLLRAGVA